MSRGTGIVMISGGLDSLLATRVLMEQDVELIGFHCILPFVASDADPSQLHAVISAEKLGFAVQTYRCDQEYVDIIRNPPHGYGKRANPCIDCHIYFLRKAAEYMQRIGADFIATGEVVGQRPMSQMRGTMNHIEKESGLIGRLLRPLSAKLLKPTIPEKDGIVDRDRLLDISGRSRKAQFELASRFGIKDYETPSGGCLFTDVNISRRAHDLFNHHHDINVIDLYLLAIGRHFRISDEVKIIVGRNENENIILEKYIPMADMFYMPEFKGPVIFVKGEITESEQLLTGRILIHYGKHDGAEYRTRIFKQGVDIGSINLQNVEHECNIDGMRI